MPFHVPQASGITTYETAARQIYFSVSNKQVRPWSGVPWVINQNLSAKSLPKSVQKQRQEGK